MNNSYPQGLFTGRYKVWRTRSNYAQVIHILAGNLTRALASILAVEPLMRVARMRSLVLIGGLLLFVNSPNAVAVNTARDVNNYKLYAHIKLHNANEYQCLVLLWNKESKWDPRANNPKSTAYGIPQLLKLKAKDPYTQIDLGLKYIDHRYGSVCKAWSYHKRTGHY